MKLRRAIVFPVLAIVGTAGALVTLATFAACSSEPAPRYGNPNNLNKDNLPGEAGVEALVCEGGVGGGDAGGGCAVSWKNDIYPHMTAPDQWQCATATCHKPNSGGNPPDIDDMDPSKALATLKAYHMTSRPQQAYIDTSKDPSKSSMDCNLRAACNPSMPIGNGKQLTSSELCTIQAWLACGAPDN